MGRSASFWSTAPQRIRQRCIVLLTSAAEPLAIEASKAFLRAQE